MLKNDRQHNGTKGQKKHKQNITQKTTDRAIRIKLKNGVNSGASEG